MDTLTRAELHRLANLNFWQASLRVQLKQLRPKLGQPTGAPQRPGYVEAWRAHLELARDKFGQRCCAGLRISGTKRAVWWGIFLSYLLSSRPALQPQSARAAT